MAIQIESIKAKSWAIKICELHGNNGRAFSLTSLCISSSGSPSAKTLEVCGGSVSFVVTIFHC